MKAWNVLRVGALAAVAVGSVAWAGVEVRLSGSSYQLALDGGTAFHETANHVSGARTIPVPDSASVLVLWNEQTALGNVPFYAISLDGRQVDCVREANYDIMLRAATFDPGKSVPAVAADLGTGGNVFIVQFVTQILPEFSVQIEQLGGRVYHFLPNYSYVVRMDAATRAAVAALPYVRWIGDPDPDGDPAPPYAGATFVNAGTLHRDHRPCICMIDTSRCTVAWHTFDGERFTAPRVVGW